MGRGQDVLKLGGGVVECVQIRTVALQPGSLFSSFDAAAHWLFEHRQVTEHLHACFLICKMVVMLAPTQQGCAED